MREKDKNWQKRHMSPWIKAVWITKPALTVIFFALVLIYCFSSLNQDILWIKKEEIPKYITIIAIFILISYFIYLELKYRAHFYMLTDSELVIQEGIFNTKIDIIPYIKIQNVNLSRSIIERIVGVGTVRIEPAGKNIGEAEVIIFWIMDYEKVLAEIFAKIEEAKKKGMDTSF